MSQIFFAFEGFLKTIFNKNIGPYMYGMGYTVCPAITKRTYFVGVALELD